MSPHRATFHLADTGWFGENVVKGTLMFTSISVYLFLACRIVLAMGEAGNFPAAIKVTAEYFPKKDRAYATSMFNAGSSVGALAAPLTIPILAAAMGWEMSFIIIGAIEKITTLLGARRYGEKDSNIAFLLTDSRSLSFPEETLFFALQSERNDGHNYIEDLHRRGVRNFCVSNSYSIPTDKEWEDTNFLVVPSTLAALQRLAERHRDEFDIPIVGITGSNGKTVVKEWLYQLLMPSMHVTRSPRSYNSQIGVPLSVWKLQERSAVGIFEAGISQMGEMQRLADIIQPTIGVSTN